MRILLASADPDEVRWATERQWADGIFLGPDSSFTSATEYDAERIAEAARLVEGTTFVSVHSVHTEEICREARELVRMAEQSTVVLPLMDDAVLATSVLAAEGVDVALNFVHNGAQALLAAKAGATGVIVPFADHEAFGQSGMDALVEIAQVLARSAPECDLIATGARGASDISACARAGVDALVLTSAALSAMLVHPLTDRGVDRYLTEVARFTHQGTN